MTYKKTAQSIVISGKEDFNPKHILESGQIFRFVINERGNYVVYSKDLCAEIEETENGYNIITSEPDYFEQFFNLNKDFLILNKKNKEYYSLFLFNSLSSKI